MHVPIPTCSSIGSQDPTRAISVWKQTWDGVSHWPLSKTGSPLYVGSKVRRCSTAVYYMLLGCGVPVSVPIEKNSIIYLGRPYSVRPLNPASAMTAMPVLSD